MFTVVQNVIFSKLSNSELWCLSTAYRTSQLLFKEPITAASDLLVHKILLNSVLLSPIVSGGVRQKPPDKHLERHGYPMVKNFENMFIRFDMIHERDRQTDKQAPAPMSLVRAYASVLLASSPCSRCGDLAPNDRLD